MSVVRYWIPGLLVAAGIVVLCVAPSDTRVEGWALFTGAGLSILLFNLLFRFGVKGEEERREEDAARAYFDEHGEWPDEDERPGGRKWKLPAGVVTPEDEERTRRA
ncbi:MAG: hypothetical protein JWN32_3654 [Solirubrobacterales bacterium]|nr:hypothetical protein [Solirubrobacterales bacterium]